MKKQLILICSVLFTTCMSISSFAAEKSAKSVVYYADLNNQAETQKVLEECKSRIKTVFDYEIVMSQDNCKNAQVGEIAAYRKQQRQDHEVDNNKTANTAQSEQTP